MKMLHLYYAFVSVLSVFLCGVLCCVPADAKAQGPFKVGVVLSLTGPAADIGVAIRNGIELAQQDKPELFKNVQFLYEDAGYDNTRAVSAFQKFVNVDKVNLVHTFGATFCQAIAPLAGARRILTAAECVDPTVAKDRPTVFRLLNYADEYMQKQIEYLSSKGLKKIALVLTDNGYLHAVSDSLRRVLPSDFSFTLVQQLPMGEMDLRSPISKIRSGDYDAVAVFLAAGQIAAFYRQAKELHLNKPSFGTFWFESANEIQLASGAMEGALLANNSIKPEFLTRYLKAYGVSTALTFSAPAYEFALIVAEIVSRHSALPTTEEFLDALPALGIRPGVAIGPYSFVDDPNVGKYFKFPIVMKKISGSGIAELND